MKQLGSYKEENNNFDEFANESVRETRRKDLPNAGNIFSRGFGLINNLFPKILLFRSPPFFFINLSKPYKRMLRQNRYFYDTTTLSKNICK